jgi:hypothetical protein
MRGARGAERFARDVGVPTTSWWNYERGIAPPPEVLLRTIILFNLSPAWLLDGMGAMFADVACGSRMSVIEQKPGPISGDRGIRVQSTST